MQVHNIVFAAHCARFQLVFFFIHNSLHPKVQGLSKCSLGQYVGQCMDFLSSQRALSAQHQFELSCWCQQYMGLLPSLHTFSVEHQFELSCFPASGIIGSTSVEHQLELASIGVSSTRDCLISLASLPGSSEHPNSIT